jgi:hypothetical protein
VLEVNARFAHVSILSPETRRRPSPKVFGAGTK